MKLNIITQTLFIMMGTIVISCTHEAIPEPGGSGGGGGGTGSTPVCFETEVLPIFQSACAKSGCHDARSAKEGYVLDNYANIVKRGITPGRATNSEIYKVLFERGDDRMPEPPNPPLSKDQSDAIGRWINEGALNTTNCASSCDTTIFSFSAGVNPILQNNCVGCHNPSSLNGGVNLGSYASVKVYADNGKLYGSMAHLSGFKPMPQGGSKLSSCQLRIVEKWIQAGAPNN